MNNPPFERKLEWRICFLHLCFLRASKAGILATVEPMVATLIGIFVFSEPLTLMSGIGVLLILAAVVILNVSNG